MQSSVVKRPEQNYIFSQIRSDITRSVPVSIPVPPLISFQCWEGQSTGGAGRHLQVSCGILCIAIVCVCVTHNPFHICAFCWFSCGNTWLVVFAVWKAGESNRLWFSEAFGMEFQSRRAANVIKLAQSFTLKISGENLQNSCEHSGAMRLISPPLRHKNKYHYNVVWQVYHSHSVWLIRLGLCVKPHLFIWRFNIQINFSLETTRALTSSH